MCVAFLKKGSQATMVETEPNKVICSNILTPSYIETERITGMDSVSAM